MQNNNEIYQFMKANSLTDKDEKTFLNEYSNPQKAKELYSFFQANKLTDKDETSFYDTYLKKKEPSQSSATRLPLPNQPINPLQQGADIVGGGVLKQVSKGIPQSVGEGIAKDKEKRNSVVGGLYNTLADSFNSLAGGLTYMAAALPSVGKKRPTDKTPEQARQTVEQFGEQFRSASSSRENEQALSKFDISDKNLSLDDIKGLAFQAPKTLLDMGIGALTGGASFFAQSVNDNAKELEKNPNASKLSSTEKLFYLYTNAAVTAALEKFSLDRVFKGSGITKKYTQKLTNEIIEDFSKRGIKATAKEIEQEAAKRAATLGQKLIRGGKRMGESIVAESSTEGLQSAAGDGVKILVNKLKGEEIFDEKDIAENFWKNTINASAAGGIFGGIIGGGGAALSNTNKGIRKQIADTTTPQELEKLQAQLNTQVEMGNITPQEAESAGIKAQQYAEIAGKIPQTVPQEKKYDIIGGIEQRETIKGEIESLKEDINSTDEAFKQPKQDQLALLEGKLGQVNDYIESLVSGVEPRYEQKDGKFYKVIADGRQMQRIEIPENHYIAGKLVEEGKKQQSKTESDAIPKQTAGEVPVQSETTVSEEVEGGKPKTELEETTTIKGNEEKVGTQPEISQPIEENEEELKRVFKKTSGTELGKAIYTTTNKFLAGNYSTGEGATKMNKKQYEGVVYELSIPKDAKIFDLSDETPNNELFDELSKNKEFLESWNNLFSKNVPKTNNEIWYAAEEAKFDLQKYLQEKGYVGARHKTYQSEGYDTQDYDYGIWDESILKRGHDENSINIYRGVKKSESKQEQGEKVKLKRQEAEPPTAEGGKKISTISGLTEEERLPLVEERRKKTSLTKKEELHNELSFLAESADKAKGNEKAKLKAEIRQKVRNINAELGDEVYRYDGTSVRVKTKKKGLDVPVYKKVTRTQRDSSLGAIKDDSVLLFDRNPDFVAEYEKLAESPNITSLSVDAGNGKRMTEQQIESALEDIADGIPSVAADNLLNALEEGFNKGYFDLRGKGIGDDSQTIQAMYDEFIGAEQETVTQPMTEEELIKFLEEESKLESEEDIELLDNIENLITEYESEPTKTISKSEIPSTKAKSETTTSERPEPIKSREGEGKPKAKVSGQPDEKTEGKDVAKQKTPPPTPPKVTKEGKEEPFRMDNKSILNRIFNSENISKEVKEKLKDKLKYKVSSQAEARKVAKEIIGEFGYENALSLAESGKFDGDVNSFIFAESLDNAFDKEAKSTTPEEKRQFAEEWKDIAMRYDEAARDKGRFISAIQEFYKKSPLGIVMVEESKRGDLFREWFSKREKPLKEVFEQLIKEPEFQEIIGKEVQEGMKKERAESRKQRRDKIEKFFD